LRYAYSNYHGISTGCGDEIDWLKHVLFNEPTMGSRDNVLQGAIANARENMGAA